MPSATTSVQMEWWFRERKSWNQGCHPLTSPPFFLQTLRSQERGWTLPALKDLSSGKSESEMHSQETRGRSKCVDVFHLICQQLNVHLVDVRPRHRCTRRLPWPSQGFVSGVLLFPFYGWKGWCSMKGYIYVLQVTLLVSFRDAAWFGVCFYFITVSLVVI